MKIIRIIFLVIIILQLNSCSKTEQSNLNNIFSLSLGYNENEIGIKLNEYNLIDYKLNMIYKNNFFYLTDSINNKILKLTEKGELLLVIYNSESNPIIKLNQVENEIPIENSDDDNTISTKLYKPFNIINPELIESDSDRNIYFVNKDPQFKKINSDKSVSDQLILKFDNNGDFLYSIGNNGLGEDPFNYITDIKIDNNNNLLVKENNDKGFNIYKFSFDGSLIKKIEINKEKIPLLKEEESYTIEIINVSLSFFENIIFVNCQYIKESTENILIPKYETIYEKILKYNIISENYIDLVYKISPRFIDVDKLPTSNNVKDMYGDNKKIPTPTDEFLGIDSEENIYLIQRNIPTIGVNDNNYNLVCYNKNGKMIKNMSINYPLDVIFTSNIILSEKGDIHSYYIKNGELVFVKIK